MKESWAVVVLASASREPSCVYGPYTQRTARALNESLWSIGVESRVFRMWTTWPKAYNGVLVQSYSNG